MSEVNPYHTPSFDPSLPPGMPSRGEIQIRKVDISSAAIMMGAMYGLGGFILGAFFTLASLVGVAANGDMGLAVGGVAAILFFPVLYGVIGAIGGAIAAAIYNLVAGMVGGIKVHTT